MTEQQGQNQGGYDSFTSGGRTASTDAQRIYYQNGPDGEALWGPSHRDFLKEVRLLLEQRGRLGPGKPKLRLAELGVAPDATLVANTLEVFGDVLEDRGLVVFEISEERLRGAESTLRERFKNRPDLLEKLSFIAGNAGKTLMEHPKPFDIIHGQLLFQHLKQRERKAVLEAASCQLLPKGLLIVSDLDFDTWDAQAVGLFGERREAKRDRETIRRLRQEKYRKEGKLDFSGKREIRKMMVDESVPDGIRPVLRVIPSLIRERPVRNIKPGSPESMFMSVIVDMLDPEHHEDTEMYKSALNNPRRRRREGYPTMVRMVAERIA